MDKSLMVKCYNPFPSFVLFLHFLNMKYSFPGERHACSAFLFCRPPPPPPHHTHTNTWWKWLTGVFFRGGGRVEKNDFSHNLYPLSTRKKLPLDLYPVWLFSGMVCNTLWYGEETEIDIQPQATCISDERFSPPPPPPI